ncbi:MAG TPA: hypothetical protein VHL59_13515 [Thermoanaerobaculia bacterium]|nr:hypothetical protein [Thermoanaerobaculia bacterium]
MGIALWLGCGFASFVIARIVPLSRRPRWAAELVAALFTALCLGAVATALDFGGWSEPDWRAGLFAFFGSFAVIGAVRALQSRRSPGGSRT